MSFHRLHSLSVSHPTDRGEQLINVQQALRKRVKNLALDEKK